jgi:hypothetical protein
VKPKKHNKLLHADLVKLSPFSLSQKAANFTKPVSKALEDFGLFKVFSLETSKPKWMCLCMVKLLFPNAARERQVMFLPFFCQIVSCQSKA